MCHLTRKKYFSALCVSMASLLSSADVFADTQILIIRHGEKPEQGLGQLSCKGFNRALSLGDVLVKRFGKPDAIIAPNPGVQKPDRGVPYSYIRPLATVEPMAIALEMPIEATIGFDDLPALEARISQALDDKQEHTIVVAWEHKIADQIAKNLVKKYAVGAEVPKWKDDDFDSIYILLKHGSDIKFHVEKQNITNLSSKCSKK